MYVCICNALKERELEAAARDDTHSVADVFRRCGRRPQCGKCLPDVAKMIEDARASDMPSMNIAAE